MDSNFARKGVKSHLAPRSYLQRRVEHLASLMDEGKLHFVEETLGRDRIDEISNDLAKVRRGSDGRIDLTSCSPAVRSLARALYTISKSDTSQDSASAQSAQAPEGDLDPVSTQREIFRLYEELAREASGSRPNRFTTVDDFHEAIKTNFMSKRVDGGHLDALIAELLPAYGRHSRAVYSAAKGLGGMKLVVGGSQRFPIPALDAVRSMLLYADTILIPDPVLPWVETQRQEEKFPFVWLFRQIFSLLHLKPLVDADLPYPAVLIFPSWEKSLEASDDETQDSLSNLYLSFFSHHLGTRFEDESEIIEFATRHEERFLGEVERLSLFIPPNGRIGCVIGEAIDAYKKDILQFRSPNFHAQLLNQPDGVLIANGITERLVPQFHLRENADAFRAAPVLWHEAHWHCFSLCAAVNEVHLLSSGKVSAGSLAVARGLSHQRFRWLGNVPIDDLVELRKRNENELFRRTLDEFTAALGAADIDDIDHALGEIGRGLATLLATHENEIRDIEERYKRRHTATALALWTTSAAQFLPWLTPFLSVLPVASAGKYMLDKVAEIQEKSAASRTLTGVLAAAHAKA